MEKLANKNAAVMSQEEVTLIDEGLKQRNRYRKTLEEIANLRPHDDRLIMVHQFYKAVALATQALEGGGDE